MASVSPLLTACGLTVAFLILPLLLPLPRGFPQSALFYLEASPLFPCETELGYQGLWLWLLGDVKSAVVQAKKEKRQHQQRELSGMSCCLLFVLAFVFNSVFTLAPLSVIKAFKETCYKNSRDNKMQTNEQKIQDKNQEI